MKSAVPVGVKEPLPATVISSWIVEPSAIVVSCTSLVWLAPRWISVVAVDAALPTVTFSQGASSAL